MLSFSVVRLLQGLGLVNSGHQLAFYIDMSGSVLLRDIGVPGLNMTSLSLQIFIKSLDRIL